MLLKPVDEPKILVVGAKVVAFSVVCLAWLVGMIPNVNPLVDCVDPPLVVNTGEGLAVFLLRPAKSDVPEALSTPGNPEVLELEPNVVELPWSWVVLIDLAAIGLDHMVAVPVEPAWVCPAVRGFEPAWVAPAVRGFVPAWICPPARGFEPARGFDPVRSGLPPPSWLNPWVFVVDTRAVDASVAPVLMKPKLL